MHIVFGVPCVFVCTLNDTYYPINKFLPHIISVSCANRRRRRRRRLSPLLFYSVNRREERRFQCETVNECQWDKIHRICVRIHFFGDIFSIDNGNQFPFYLLPTLLFFLSRSHSLPPQCRFILIVFDNRIEIDSRAMDNNKNLQLSVSLRHYLDLCCIYICRVFTRTNWW